MTDNTETADSKEFGKLIASNKGLLVSQVLFFHPRSKHDFDDYFQVACLSIYLNYKKFDPEKGKLSTFLTTIIKNSIKNYINKTISLEQLKKDIPYLSKESIWEYIPNTLTKKELRVLRMRIDGYTQKEISLKMDIDVEEVIQLSRKAISKIRKSK